MRIIKQDMRIWVEYDEFNSIDWYKNCEPHREDGPAEVWGDGERVYYLNNFFYDEEPYWKKIHENY